MQRFGLVVGVKPEQIEEYERIHREVWPEVLENIHRHNIRNYSIFRHGDLLFAYYEYIGNDYEADMKSLAADPKNQDWWKITDPMQEPVADRAPGEWWKILPEVFHTD